MKRNDTMLMKSGNGYSPVKVLATYDNPIAVRVLKNHDEWIVKPEDLTSEEAVEKAKADKIEKELREKYSDALRVYVDGDNHTTLAEKLGILPLVAFGKLKAMRNHGLIT